MPRKSQITHLALLLCQIKRFGRPAWSVKLIHLLRLLHLMQHPKIHPVGLEATERILQILHRPLFSALGQRLVVGAALRHDKCFVPNSLQSLPHPLLGPAPMITPGVIKKRYATLHRLMRNPCRLGNVFGQPQSMTSEAKNTHPLVIPAKLPGWNPPANRPALRQTQPWN